MVEFSLAVDTATTGYSFESLNKGKKQTDFIKEYDLKNGKKLFYTARRGRDNVIYSWHELNPNQYKRKFEEWKKQNGGGE